MTAMRISIALCTYNGERYLREQLDSIARQTRLPDEMIICDDGSSDHSVDIINAFSALIPFPLRIYESRSNIGSTKSFEKAISLCDGDIIALSDQDDVWHEKKLEFIEAVFNSSEQIGAVFSNGNIVDDTLSPLGYTLWDTYEFRKKSKSRFMHGKAFEILLNHNVITGATMAFRTRYRRKVLPIPSIWVHDAWIALVMSSISEIRFIDKEMIDYRQHEQQQIGGREMKIAEQVAFSSSVTDYKLQIEQYRLISEHILMNACEAEQFIASRIADKIMHLHARQDAYRSTAMHKMLIIAEELLRGRYHKYSRGFRSFVKDIATSIA
ncbi:MAG: glycosyltransferase family 2 protein [Nitrospirota bacterium]